MRLRHNWAKDLQLISTSVSASAILLRKEVDMERKYGWIHSCGMFHYQLDHPIVCRFCNKRKGWVWYDSEPVEADDVHRKNHSHNR
jgi:hypothetical protein